MELVYFLIILAILGTGFYYLGRIIKERDSENKDNTSFLLIQDRLNDLNRVLDRKLSDVSENTRHQFSENLKIISQVTEKLTKIDETNKQVVNFADQLKSLQDILKNPKQRGLLGEYYLETILRNIFSPRDYQTQYQFKDGKKVDAAIFVGQQIVPIDSKFSLENYNRLAEESNPGEKERLEKRLMNDLKERIDETAEYIKPNEGTLNVAFMFIPSEAIYYDLLINQNNNVKSNARNLIDYAYNEKHVIIVSPNTLAAYFQVLLQAIRAFHIQESTEEIEKEVENLGRHLKNFDEYMLRLGKNLGQTVSAYNTTSKELGKIDRNIEKITGSSAKIEPLILDKPGSASEE